MSDTVRAKGAPANRRVWGEIEGEVKSLEGLGVPRTKIAAKVGTTRQTIHRRLGPIVNRDLGDETEGAAA